MSRKAHVQFCRRAGAVTNLLSLTLALVVIVIVGAIRVVAPTSGLSQSLHQGFHALALGVQWIANGLAALAQLLDQL